MSAHYHGQTLNASEIGRACRGPSKATPGQYSNPLSIESRKFNLDIIRVFYTIVTLKLDFAAQNKGGRPSRPC